jgi:hypothetical protein
MRRRVVCPRSHPASPFARVLSVRFAMARGIFRGIPLGPPCRPMLAGCAPTSPPPPGSLRPPDGPVLGSLRLGLLASSGGSAAHWAAFVGCPAGSKLGARRAPRSPSSLAVAALAPHLRFGRGCGAASSLRNRQWRRISVAHLAVAANLGSIPPRYGRSPLMPARGTVPVAGAHPVAPHPVPIRPLFTSRTLVTLRLRHTAISRAGLPSVARKAIQAHLHVHCSRPGCEP